MLHISLQSEYIVKIFGISITSTFLTSLLVTFLLTSIALVFYLSRNKQGGIIKRVFQVFVYEMLTLIDSVTHDRTLSKKFLPLIVTFFLFIGTANLLALIPGFLGSFYIEKDDIQLSILRSPNSDLTTTLALAIFSVLSIQYFSLSILGPKKFIARFISFKSPIKFILGFFEILSSAIKIISFSFRLFGNIFAGEVLLLVIAFLIPYIIPLPFMVLEIFVGIIQAFIFAILTLTFIESSILENRTEENSTFVHDHT